MHFDKYFAHIIWVFVLMTFMVWINFRMEKSFLKVEKNKAVIENLVIQKGQTTCELEKLKRISTVEEMLKNKGSEIGIPSEAPSLIVKDID